jgi:hypothetical protein
VLILCGGGCGPYIYDSAGYRWSVSTPYIHLTRMPPVIFIIPNQGAFVKCFFSGGDVSGVAYDAGGMARHDGPFERSHKEPDIALSERD